MESSTILKGAAAVVGGASLIYWLTRKKDAPQIADGGYEVRNGKEVQSPLPRDFAYGPLCDDRMAFCGPSDSKSWYQPNPDLSKDRKKFWHAAYGHWC